MSEIHQNNASLSDQAGNKIDALIAHNNGSKELKNTNDAHFKNAFTSLWQWVKWDMKLLGRNIVTAARWVQVAGYTAAADVADVADTANKKVIQPTGDYLARVPGAVNDTVVSPTIVYGKRIPGAAKEVVIDPALEIHQAAVTEVSNGAFAVTHEFPAAVKQAAKDAVVWAAREVMAEVNRGTPGTKPTLVSKSEILASVSLKNTDSITQRMSAEGKALFKQIINTPNPLQAEVLRGSIHNWELDVKILQEKLSTWNQNLAKDGNFGPRTLAVLANLKSNTVTR